MYVSDVDWDGGASPRALAYVSRCCSTTYRPCSLLCYTVLYCAVLFDALVGLLRLGGHLG